MSQFPRWRGLKHFEQGVTQINFTDGQTFFDIMRVRRIIHSSADTIADCLLSLSVRVPQCLVPCIVQLLPRKSPVIPYLRSIQKVGMLVRMHVMTDRLTSASGTSRPERPPPPSNNPTIFPTRLERLEQYIQAYGRHSKVCQYKLNVSY